MKEERALSKYPVKALVQVHLRTLALSVELNEESHRAGKLDAVLDFGNHDAWRAGKYLEFSAQDFNMVNELPLDYMDPTPDAGPG